MPDAVSLQRDYYRSTADAYDDMHSGEQANNLAVPFTLSAIDFLSVRSVLDVGSGTGHILGKIRMAHSSVRATGIEPCAELREQAYKKGLSKAELIDGDVQSIAFQDGAFDLVCAFGVVHHVPDPRQAVREILRVARRAVFICDSNNFGQGSLVLRSVKQAMHAFGLWPLADYIKTRGKGYTISDGDGLAYSYSLFDDYPQIKKACRTIHLLNTENSGPNLYRCAPGVAILGIK